MTPAIFQVVSASAACRSILGSPPSMRFREFGIAKQGEILTQPYAVWQLITGVPANYLGQLPDNDETRIQVDVYAQTMLKARALAIAVRDAIEPHAQMLSFAQRAQDPVTLNYSFFMDFSFFTPRDTDES